MRGFILTLTAALGLLAGAAKAADHPPHWMRPGPALHILGNVYYVGTEGLSSFLVTGPEGHVLIDGGLPSSAPLIARNITALGFKLSDVKVILINHSHYDHAGGLAELKQLTGARLVASAGDRTDLEAGRTVDRPELEGFPPVKVDEVVEDGDTVRVGPVVLTALLTPGHTTGATSWITTADGRQVIFTSSLTVAGQALTGSAKNDKAAADFRATFARLRATPADVFLNFHAEGFDLEAKRARRLAGQAEAFVDPGELKRRVDSAQAAFEAELAKQKLPAS